MNINDLIAELESKVKQGATQLEQSLANHNFLAGVKAESERILALLKSNVEDAIVKTTEQATSIDTNGENP